MGTDHLARSERLDKVVELYRSGLSQRGVAKAMRISGTQVNRLLRAADIKCRTRKVQKPVKIILMLETSALKAIRKQAGRGKVNDWIRKAIAMGLCDE